MFQVAVFIFQENKYFVMIAAESWCRYSMRWNGIAAISGNYGLPGVFCLDERKLLAFFNQYIA